MLLLALMVPCCLASSLPIEAAFGTWLGTLHNNPTMIYVAPRTLQVEANDNPFRPQSPTFALPQTSPSRRWTPACSSPGSSSALGSRFLQVRFCRVGLAAKPLHGIWRHHAPTAVQPLSAQISNNELMSTPTFLYFKGTKLQEYGPDARGNPAAQQLCTHTVAAGESVASVAAKYGQQWQDLFALNAFLTDPEQSVVGRTLAIGRAYRVAPGESLVEHRVHVRHLVAAAGGREPALAGVQGAGSPRVPCLPHTSRRHSPRYPLPAQRRLRRPEPRAPVSRAVAAVRRRLLFG